MKIERMCEEVGMTVDELADAIGVSTGYLLNTDVLPMCVLKSVELYIENVKLRGELEEYRIFGKVVRKIFGVDRLLGIDTNVP